MPLYDCMLLLKPHVKKESLIDLVARVGKHIYRRNGVLTEVKSFGTVQLGYGIKKLDGRYFQARSSYGINEMIDGYIRDVKKCLDGINGQLMQMTMMTPPSINSELHYLNKEDRLLRWLLVKHRDVKYGVEFVNEFDEEEGELSKFRSSALDDDTEEDDDDELDEEYDLSDDEEPTKEN